LAPAARSNWTWLPYNARMSRTLRWIVVVVFVLAAAAVLRWTVFEPKPLEVQVARVDRGPVEEAVTNTRAGTVKVRRRAKLSPQVGGRVVELPHREGDVVRKGDLLLRLDDRPQRAQLEVARRDVTAAQRRAEEACLAAELAAKELVRARGLAKAGIASDQQLDSATTEQERTAAACAAARAAVEQARAGVHAAQVQVDLTELHAPFDGVLAQVSTQVGEWITPSPPGVPIPPVFDLLDRSSIYISAPIDEVDSLRVHRGQEARITVDSRPGKEFPGHVVRVAPYVEDVLEQNRTVEVECELEDPSLAADLLPGTSADVEIVLRRKDNALRVPTAAIGEGKAVLVLENGKLEERTITTGLGNWELTEVVKGLKEGELVVTLRDSTAVKAGVRAVPKP